MDGLVRGVYAAEESQPSGCPLRGFVHGYNGQDRVASIVGPYFPDPGPDDGRERVQGPFPVPIGEHREPGRMHVR